MTNPKKTYNDFVRANLPTGVTFDSDLARYFVNEKRRLNYQRAEDYLNYIEKFGFISGPTPAETTLSTTATFRGVTFTFNKAMPVCYSCLGEPAVISTEAFTVTSISPESVDIVGATGTWRAYGAELNPMGVAAADDFLTAQGFDELLETEDGGATYAIPYSAARNVDPAVGGALAFAEGATGSLVKSVRVTGVTDPLAADGGYIDKYVVLSVLDTVPPEGFFRPGIAGTDKTIPDNWREGAVNYSVLRNETAITGGYDQAAAEAAIKPTLPNFGIGWAEQKRRLDVENIGVNFSNYSRDFGLQRGDAFTFLHSSGTNAAKRITFLRSIQHGIDTHAEISQNGVTFIGGAGQYYGGHFFTYAAAFALNDTDILTSAKAQYSSTLRQHGWVESENIGQAALFPATAGDNYVNYSTYTDEDLGIPEWLRDPSLGTNFAVPDPPGQLIGNNASALARYRELYPVGMVEALNIALLQNGPGGITGEDAILDGGAFDNTNIKAAALAFYDRGRPMQDYYPLPTAYLTAPRKEAWDNRRSLLSSTPWTGRPDQFETGSTVPTAGNAQVSVSTDGEIDYDWSDHVWHTETVTQNDIRYSLDGVQWVEVLDVADTGTISSLLRGVSHEVSFRRVSASGAGRWSPTWPHTGALGSYDDRRNVIATTGTATAAAPVNTVAPKIYVPAFENYDGEEYAEAPLTVTEAFMQRENNLTFIAGVGYYTGYPAPTFTYQWQKDGVNISGATSKEYSPSWIDVSDVDLTCEVTATNASGAITTETAAIAIPAEVEPTAPTVFSRVDTNGTGVLTRTGALANATAGPQGTLAFRGKLLSGDGTFRRFIGLGRGFSTDAIYLQATSTNLMQLQLRTAESGTLLLNHSTTGISFNVALGDFTFLMSWNLATSTSQIYVNGVDRGATPATITNGNVGYDTTAFATPDWAIMGTPKTTPDQIPDMELDYMLLSDAYVDLSVSGNRAVFDDPSALGYWGSGGTGSRPLIFAWGDASTWNGGTANQGVGGAFPAFSGTFTDVP